MICSCGEGVKIPASTCFKCLESSLAVPVSEQWQSSCFNVQVSKADQLTRFSMQKLTQKNQHLCILSKKVHIMIAGMRRCVLTTIWWRCLRMAGNSWEMAQWCRRVDSRGLVQRMQLQLQLRAVTKRLESLTMRQQFDGWAVEGIYYIDSNS